MKKKILTSLAVLAACAATGYGIHGWTAKNAAGTSVVTTPAGGVAPRWQVGQRYVLRYILDASARLQLPDVAAAPGQDESSLALDGELVLSAYGQKGGATLVGAQLRTVQQHRLRVLGQDALADDAVARATLEGHEAFLAVKPDGSVASLLFRKDAPPLFKTILQQVVSTLALTVPEGSGPAWSAAEHGLFGQRSVRYERTEDSSLRRVPGPYTRLDALPMITASTVEQAGAARIVLDAEGAVTDIDDEETVTAAAPSARAGAFQGRYAVHVTMLRKEAFAPPTTMELDPAVLEDLVPGAPVAPEDLAVKGVEQVAASMDTTTLLATLAGYAGGGHLAPGFVQRAVAFLQVHPEECASLLRLFGEGTVKIPGRLLILDVLASTGHEQAQAALRQALALPVAHESDRAYTMMVQRLGLLARPDAESLAFLRKEVDRAHAKDVRYGALYALGAAAGSADPGDAAGQSAAARVRTALTTARTEEDKSAALVALGNAHRAEDVPRIAAYARDEASSVRASVARALVRNEAEGARKVLVELVGDESADVAVTALGGLARQPASAAEVSALAALVEADRLPAGSESALVELAARQIGGGNDAALRALLQGLLPRVTTELGAKIHYILANLGNAG